jgi:hypothetical protein
VRLPGGFLGLYRAVAAPAPARFLESFFLGHGACLIACQTRAKWRLSLRKREVQGFRSVAGATSRRLRSESLDRPLVGGRHGWLASTGLSWRAGWASWPGPA